MLNTLLSVSHLFSLYCAVRWLELKEIALILLAITFNFKTNMIEFKIPDPVDVHIFCPWFSQWHLDHTICILGVYFQKYLMYFWVVMFYKANSDQDP